MFENKYFCEMGSNSYNYQVLYCNSVIRKLLKYFKNKYNPL